MWYGDLGWGAWLAMSLGMLAFWGLVIWAVVALVRSSAGDVSRRGATPEQVLADRFARGEIHEDDHRRCLAALRDAQTAAPVGTGDPS